MPAEGIASLLSMQMARPSTNHIAGRTGNRCLCCVPKRFGPVQFSFMYYWAFQWLYKRKPICNEVALVCQVKTNRSLFPTGLVPTS